MELTRREGLAALAAAAAMVGAPRYGVSAEPEIVIGSPHSLTGLFGENGTRAVWGLMIAADEINAKGGIKSLGGAKLKVVAADTSSEAPAQAASVTRRMIDQDKAVMLFGSAASAMTLATQVEAEKSGIPLITESYADTVVQRGMKYTFKITVLGSAIWNFAFDATVDMLKAVGAPPNGIGLYMASDAVDQVIAKTMPEEAKRIGVAVLSQVNYQNGLTDPTVVVAPARDKKPDLILLGGGLSDEVLIIQALRGLGITTPILTAGGITSDSGGKALGSGAANVLMPVHWNWDMKTPHSSEILEAYKKAHPSEPTPPNSEYLGLGYTAGAIIAQALEKAASRDGAKIRDVLLSTEFTDIPLAGGKVAFDANGQNKLAQGIVCEWMSPTEARTIWPKDLQTVPPKLSKG